MLNLQSYVWYALIGCCSLTKFNQCELSADDIERVCDVGRKTLQSESRHTPF